MENRKKLDNVSYIFIPFDFGGRDLFRPLVRMLKESSSWDQQDINVRYMLKYVADKINAGNEAARQCFQFRLRDDAREKFGLPSGDEWCITKPYKYKEDRVTARFKLVDIRMFCFRTSVGIMAIRVSFEKDDPYWISNALYQIKKVSREKVILGGSGTERSLLGICRILAREFRELCRFEFFPYTYKGRERANALIFLESELKDDFSEELFYLRRCYSQGYKYLKNEKQEAEELHCPSYGMNWGISPEAAACIACPEAGIGDFLKDTFYDNFNSQYLLMYVLLLHQKYVLYMYLTNIGSSDRNDLEVLENYKNELYEFETDFVFSCITEVPQYQDLYDKIAESFSLRKMYEDVHEPILSLTEVRRAAAEKEQASRDKNINKALFLLSGLSIFSAFVDSYDFAESFLENQFGASAGVISFTQAALIVLIIAVAGYISISIWRSARKTEKQKRITPKVMKDKYEYKYLGCFFDEETAAELRKHREGEALAKEIRDLHITTEYKPDFADTELFGKEINVTVTGYGNNGRNEGFLVEVTSKDEEIQEMLDRIETPHITLSRALDAESVDTKALEFREIEPFEVTGRYGGFIEGSGPVTGKPQ